MCWKITQSHVISDDRIERLAILSSDICDWSILMTYQTFDFYLFLIGHIHLFFEMEARR